MEESLRLFGLGATRRAAEGRDGTHPDRQRVVTGRHVCYRTLASSSIKATTSLRSACG